MNGTGPRVVVCVPCWNLLPFTRRMVESVLRNSEGYDVRFVFVNNGSDDGTGAYLDSVPHTARVIYNPVNVGVNPAWNQMLAVALELDPAVVVLANNDIMVGPGWLDPVVREIAKGDKRYFLPNGSFGNPDTFDNDVRAALPQLHGSTPGRAGWCLSFPPEAIPIFLPIPPELVLWYGDDWIHHKLAEQGYTCEVLAGSCCLHFTSKSVQIYPGLVERVAMDRAAFFRLTGIQL